LPYIFIKADAEISVDLPEAGFMPKWESKEAEEVCIKYDHPNCTINCRIDNPQDPISPVLIMIGDKDAIDGKIEVTKNSSTNYLFKISGTFKTSVHKSAIPLINAGMQPVLEGVTRFREGFIFEKPRQIDWTFSTKKI
jgi:hypothetical protein